MHWLLLVLFVVWWFGSCTGLVEKDEVKSLPGFDGSLPSRHFSGYLDISETKHLHYYLIEKQGDADENTPIVLWMNGGPGCSSLDGLFLEHGPFRFDTTGGPLKLKVFDQSWANLAHMLYLEAPAGVGFSYSDDKSEYVTNDDITASDNLKAVEKFFELYSEFKSHPFFIVGESYAGVYVPTLAEAVMKADLAGTYTGARLMGIAVGNGCTGTEIGVCGNEVESAKYLSAYLAQTALISQQTKDDLKKDCKDFTEEVCKQVLDKMHKEVGNVNLYNIYGECHGGATVALKAPLPWFEKKNNERLAMTGSSLESLEPQAVKGPVPCIDSRVISRYLVRTDVTRAIHVKTPPFEWGICANSINYTSTRKNLPRDTYPALAEYLETVLIYNGDFDACVPYSDNMAWTSNMKFPVVKEWHPWSFPSPDDASPQVAGYATVYKTPKKGNKFIFTTIRGGRHEVPETAPDQAFEMMRRLLNKEDF